MSRSPSLRLDSNRRLVLKNRQLTSRVAELFNNLDSNAELQQDFIESPMDVIGSHVLGQEYTTAQVSAVNRFIFAVLANERLHEWAREYDQQHAGQEIDSNQRLRDLAQAFTEYGDPAIITGLLEMAEHGALVPGLAEDSAVIVKADTYAIGNWVIYKVSGRRFGDDDLILPAARIQQIAEQLVIRAQELSRSGQL